MPHLIIKGYVHRDIKPSNILLKKETVKYSELFKSSCLTSNSHIGSHIHTISKSNNSLGQPEAKARYLSNLRQVVNRQVLEDDTEGTQYGDNKLDSPDKVGPKGF